ncbi:OmpA family protein [Pedobacter polaris]|uniref:OmpA family protein n=1 Tax=Pedobacter polaris TaxID=2571273 RepID=A0A4U1CRW3_9SPHI|nr:OmpA family protein [Pedobacter polaris]TKC10423.1 OmpA family protein [Pedobacter polaris]
MLALNKIIQKTIACCLMLLLIQTTLHAQTTPPKWWFGVAGASNFNFFDGTTQRLNNGLIVPTAFHEGKGVKPFGSVLVEYRPTPIWGGTLNIGYDGRGGKFDGVIAPCDCPATLATNVSYLTIEPTLRVNPWGGNLFFFAGPRLAFNLQKDFDYTQLKQENTSSEFSEVRKNIISGQVGAGYDIDISSPTSTTKFVIAPFVSFHPYFGQDVRKIESWSMTTVRTGIAFKFGKGKAVAKPETAVVPVSLDVNFSVKAPSAVIMKRKVSESLPILNYVFFDEGATTIPSRYVLLSPAQAAKFKQEDLQQEPSENMNVRSERQLKVYYNILNILGDRMRANPEANITLSGASLAGPVEGKTFAMEIKKYLVDVYAINENRIATNGRTKPVNPSEQVGGKKELNLLREGDRRVDIQSNSSALLMVLGGELMKPIQINATQVDPKDSAVTFYVGKASEVLSSYTLDVTDPNGTTKQYGPFTKNEERISGKTIFTNNTPGSYKVVMLGTTKTGNVIRKESAVQLMGTEEQTENGLRYSILYNFNKANTTATYAKFLTDEVAPLISENSTVIIHGHTDIIGSEKYNLELSNKRAQETQQILEAALAKAGKRNVKFETTGNGEATDSAPFENSRPEERFYNRTVVIDINTVK